MTLNAERVARAGAEVVDALGVDGLTLSAVAESLGVTTPALYRHVGNAAGLRRAVFAEATRRLRETITGALAPPTARSRLERLLTLYREFAVSHPGLYELLFVDPGNLSDRRYPEGFRDRPAETFTFLVDRVRDAMAEGAIPESDPTETALFIWAEIHGLVMLARAGRFGGDPEAFAALYDRFASRILGAPDVRRGADDPGGPDAGGSSTGPGAVS